MYYGNIKYSDIADGTGVRTTLFVSGCLNHCKGCFQPQTWDFSFGKPFTKEVEDEIIRETGESYIQGLTLLGGDPFEIENQRALLPFLKRFKKQLPGKSIWAYTGYIYDRDLLEGGKRFCEATAEMLSLIDILVDGPFIEEEKSLLLRFRGSANQRIIDLDKTRQEGKMILWEGTDKRI